MTKLTKQETIGFIIPSNNINEKSVEKVNKYLPELLEKTKAFGSRNSQTTLSLMSLTMLNGHSPYRLLRQILAETEKRKSALAQAQFTYAETLSQIERLKDSTDPVDAAAYRHKCVELSSLENAINGSFGDIATLIDAYNNIKKANNIEDWDEVAFEKEEKRHHVRRAYELMYRDLLQVGRAQPATIEYCQQMGIHPQICFTEVSTYINNVNERIERNESLHANDLEDFLDEMGNKYHKNVDKTAERLFGKADFVNKDYMYDMMKQTARN